MMKHSNVVVAQTINAAPEQAWEVIGAVKGVDQWFAPISACRVEGNKRYCTAEGSEFEEDILKVDHENRVFKYAIKKQHLVPVQNVIGEMKVQEGESGNATIQWSWNFEVEKEKEAEAKETFGMMGNMGIQGIEELIKKQVIA